VFTYSSVTGFQVIVYLEKYIFIDLYMHVSPLHYNSIQRLHSCDSQECQD
jgi:hypothetical protein